MFWDKKSSEEQQQIIADALEKNIGYFKHPVLGVPGSFLDREVFPVSEKTKNYSFLSTFVQNPNHIGVHTLQKSEEFFGGTQQLERDVLRICAEEIMQAEVNSYDGYIAPGGTEGNIQALWTYRNFFQSKFQSASQSAFQSKNHARTDSIAVVCSEDSHYSIAKGANLLSLSYQEIPVNEMTRQMSQEDISRTVSNLQEQGVENFIFVLNMGTTMFGSVDDINEFSKALEGVDINFRVHVDAAFGGFIYPLINLENTMNFSHPLINSMTLDAHKMLQAPYGTGIFLIRKNYMNYTVTEEARYVKGLESTLCGSRSGANAVAIWMILYSYGSEGGKEFCHSLIEKTDYLCKNLDKKNIRYFRDPMMNIVTIKAEDLDEKIANKFYLVPDRHDRTVKWYKIVVMDHVNQPLMEQFIQCLEAK